MSGLVDRKCSRLLLPLEDLRVRMMPGVQDVEITGAHLDVNRQTLCLDVKSEHFPPCLFSLVIERDITGLPITLRAIEVDETGKPKSDKARLPSSFAGAPPSEEE